MTLDRRRFLVLGAVAPAAGLAACTDTPPDREARSRPDEVPDADLDSLEFAAGLEVVVAAAYRTALEDLGAGRMGEVPAAGAELIQSAATQHGECLAELNRLLERAGREAVGDGNVEFETTVITPALTAAKGWPDLANSARTVETALSATYLESIHTTLQSRDALRLAAGIQATGQKRVAILNFLLGGYPVPDAFQKTDAAVRP